MFKNKENTSFIDKIVNGGKKIEAFFSKIAFFQAVVIGLSRASKGFNSAMQEYKTTGRVKEDKEEKTENA